MGLLEKIRNRLTTESYSTGDASNPSEILYVDEPRVGSYFNQISDPVTYDEVDEWKAKFSITNLGVTRKNRKSGREPTLEEKISAIIKYLEENDRVSTHRPLKPFPSDERERRFRLERIATKRGHVPSPADDDRMNDLWIWASEYSETPPSKIPETYSESISSNVQSKDSANSRTTNNPIGPLILIEESQQSSRRPSRFSGVSTLSALISSHNISNRLDDTPLNETLDITFKDKKYENLESKDALNLLSDVGTEFGRQREIVALYSVELVYNDSANDFAVTTFGYPVVIWEAQQR